MLQVAFYCGRTRLFDRAVQWWTRGRYSHCELVTGPAPDGAHWCISASMLDGGVRIKAITLHPDRWHLVPVPWCDCLQASRWLQAHAGQGYDFLGLLGFVWRPQAGRGRRWFCSEAVGAALGLPDPWRFDPSALHAVVTMAQQMERRHG